MVANFVTNWRNVVNPVGIKTNSTELDHEVRNSGNVPGIYFIFEKSSDNVIYVGQGGAPYYKDGQLNETKRTVKIRVNQNNNIGDAGATFRKRYLMMNPNVTTDNWDFYNQFDIYFLNYEGKTDQIKFDEHFLIGLLQPKYNQ